MEKQKIPKIWLIIIFMMFSAISLAQQTITVNPLPVINAGRDTTICIGKPIILKATYANGTVSWDKGVVDGVAFVPTTTTIYTATIIGTCGTITDQVTVTVNNNPNVNAGRDTVICAGSSIILKAIYANGTVSWDKGVVDGVAFVPTTTTTYTATVIGTCGTITDQVTVIVNPTPAVSAGPDLILPIGIGQTVQAQASTDNPNNTISWSSGTGSFSSNILRPYFNTVGTYTIKATNSVGCFVTDDLIVRLQTPLDTFWTTLPEFCPDDNQIFLDNYTNPPGKGTFSGTGVSGRSLIPPSTPGNYTITWVIGNKTLLVNYTVYQNPIIYFPEDTVLRCPASNITLGAAGYADKYSWNLLGNSTVLATSQYYEVVVPQTNPSSYVFTAGNVYYNKNCYSRDTVTVVPIIAGFTYTQQRGNGPYGEIYGSKVTFTPNFKNSDITYSWNFGNNYISGGGTSTEMSPIYDYNPYLGYFTVKLVMTSFCGTSTSSQEIRVNSLDVSTGIENLNKEEIILYPNPAVDYINLSFGNQSVSNIQIYNLNGKNLFNDKVTGSNYVLNVSNYTSGNYIVKVFDKQGRFVTAKFIKQ